MAASLERTVIRASTRFESIGFFPNWTVRDLSIYIASALFFYLPVSMPIHIGIQHFLRHRSPWIIFAYPETWAILLLAGLAWTQRREHDMARPLASDRIFRGMLATSGVYVIAATIGAAVQGSDSQFAIRKLAMEWVLPMILAASLWQLWSAELDRTILRSLIQGTFLLMVVGLFTYLLSFGIPRSFYELVFINRTGRIWEGLAGGVFFSEIPFGGVNSLASHIATVSCLVVGAAVAPRGLYRFWAYVWLGLAWLVEFLCFSRGVLLFLFVAVAALAAVAAAHGLFSSMRAVVVMTILLALGAVLPPGALAYWGQQFGIRSESSAASRISQWEHLVGGQEVNSREIPAFAKRQMAAELGDGMRKLDERLGPKARSQDVTYELARRKIEARIGGPTRRLLVGYGLGNYGVLRGLVPDSGSHNIFFDAFLEAGAVGAISFVALFALGFLRRLTSWRRKRGDFPDSMNELSRLLALASIAGIGILVDYRLENLGTMVGAAVLWFLLIPQGDPRVEKRSAETVRGSTISGAVRESIAR